MNRPWLKVKTQTRTILISKSYQQYNEAKALMKYVTQKISMFISTVQSDQFTDLLHECSWVYIHAFLLNLEWDKVNFPDTFHNFPKQNRVSSWTTPPTPHIDIIGYWCSRPAVDRRIFRLSNSRRRPIDASNFRYKSAISRAYTPYKKYRQ